MKFLNITALSILLIFSSASAAPIYYTSVGVTGNDVNYSYKESTNYVYMDYSDFGISSQWASASANSNGIHVEAYNAIRTDSGSKIVPYQPFARGSITYNDIVFTDTLNPGATGSTDIQINFSIFEDSAKDLMAQLFLGGGGQGYAIYRPVGSGDYTSQSFTVQLNIPVTLELRLSLFDPGIAENGSRISVLGKGSMNLSALPFSLATGINVTSMDLGLTDTTGSIPEPASLWLMTTGLIGLFGGIKSWKNK